MTDTSRQAILKQLAAGTGAIAVAGPGTAWAQQEPLRIACIHPLTGPIGVSGNAMLTGASIAADQSNRNGACWDARSRSSPGTDDQPDASVVNGHTGMTALLTAIRSAGTLQTAVVRAALERVEFESAGALQDAPRGSPGPAAHRRHEDHPAARHAGVGGEPG